MNDCDDCIHTDVDYKVEPCASCTNIVLPIKDAKDNFVKGEAKVKTKQHKKPEEYILCSAIKYGDTIIAGRRHSDCYAVLKGLLSEFTTPDKLKLPEREDQGFLTSKNRFVNRKEAWVIAKERSQIWHGLTERGEREIDKEVEKMFAATDAGQPDFEILTSEDLY